MEHDLRARVHLWRPWLISLLGIAFVLLSGGVRTAGQAGVALAIGLTCSLLSARQGVEVARFSRIRSALALVFAAIGIAGIGWIVLIEWYRYFAPVELLGELVRGAKPWKRPPTGFLAGGMALALATGSWGVAAALDTGPLRRRLAVAGILAFAVAEALLFRVGFDRLPVYASLGLLSAACALVPAALRFRADRGARAAGRAAALPLAALLVAGTTLLISFPREAEPVRHLRCLGMSLLGLAPGPLAEMPVRLGLRIPPSELASAARLGLAARSALVMTGALAIVRRHPWWFAREEVLESLLALHAGEPEDPAAIGTLLALGEGWRMKWDAKVVVAIDGVGQSPLEMEVAVDRARRLGAEVTVRLDAGEATGEFSVPASLLEAMWQRSPRLTHPAWRAAACSLADSAPGACADLILRMDPSLLEGEGPALVAFLERLRLGRSVPLELRAEVTGRAYSPALDRAFTDALARDPADLALDDPWIAQWVNWSVIWRAPAIPPARLEHALELFPPGFPTGPPGSVLPGQAVSARALQNSVRRIVADLRLDPAVLRRGCPDALRRGVQNRPAMIGMILGLADRGILMDCLPEGPHLKSGMFSQYGQLSGIDHLLRCALLERGTGALRDPRLQGGEDDPRTLEVRASLSLSPELAKALIGVIAGGRPSTGLLHALARLGPAADAEIEKQNQVIPAGLLPFVSGARAGPASSRWLWTDAEQRTKPPAASRLNSGCIATWDVLDGFLDLDLLSSTAIVHQLEAIARGREASLRLALLARSGSPVLPAIRSWIAHCRECQGRAFEALGLLDPRVARRILAGADEAERKQAPLPLRRLWWPETGEADRAEALTELLAREDLLADRAGMRLLAQLAREEPSLVAARLTSELHPRLRALAELALVVAGHGSGIAGPGLLTQNADWWDGLQRERGPGGRFRSPSNEWLLREAAPDAIPESRLAKLIGGPLTEEAFALLRPRFPHAAEAAVAAAIESAKSAPFAGPFRRRLLPLWLRIVTQASAALEQEVCAEIEFLPGHPDGHFLRAELHRRRGQQLAAVDELCRALDCHGEWGPEFACFPDWFCEERLVRCAANPGE